MVQTIADVVAADTFADQIMKMAAMMGLDRRYIPIFRSHDDKTEGAVDKGQVAEASKGAFKLDKHVVDKIKGAVDKGQVAEASKGALEEKAAYIAETIKLGMMVNEELCEKGKRYIKARQAAGEKSSAYLSGRAVRVCKGQIEWPKKGKNKK